MRTPCTSTTVGDPATRIDLFHLYFDDDGRAALPVRRRRYDRCQRVGVARAPRRSTSPAGRRSSRPTPSSSSSTSTAPTGAARSPGFDWDRDRTDRARGGVCPRRTARRSTGPTSTPTPTYAAGSTFFDAVNATRPTCRRPSSTSAAATAATRYAFAHGRASRCIGLDRSRVGVRHAAKSAGSMGSRDRRAFAVCDVSDAAALRAVLAERITAADDRRCCSTCASSCTRSPRTSRRRCWRRSTRSPAPATCSPRSSAPTRTKRSKKVHTQALPPLPERPGFGATLRDSTASNCSRSRRAPGCRRTAARIPSCTGSIARRG